MKNDAGIQDDFVKAMIYLIPRFSEVIVKNSHESYAKMLLNLLAEYA